MILAWTALARTRFAPTTVACAPEAARRRRRNLVCGSIVIALLVGGVGGAPAQWPGGPPAAQRPAGPSPFDAPPAPGRAGSSPFDAPTAASPFGAPQQDPPCMKDFLPLRQDAEKKAGLIRAASQRKAPREEVCKLLQNFAAAEAKMVTFVETNSRTCGIPPQISTQIKASHERTLKARTQVCAAGPAGAGKPVAPSLSDALGTANAPIPDTAKSGSSAFDTLTGNALTR
jgi:hypothetical protein